MKSIPPPNYHRFAVQYGNVITVFDIFYAKRFISDFLARPHTFKSEA